MAGVVRAGNLRDRVLEALAFARKNGGRLYRDEVTGFWGAEQIDLVDDSRHFYHHHVKRLVTDRFMRWSTFEQIDGMNMPVEAEVILR